VCATLTWYGPEGFYADGQAQLSWYGSDLKSATLGTLVENNKGKGEAFSVELGKRSSIGSTLTITPQIQMIYSNVSFDTFADRARSVVISAKGDSLKSRWGFSIDDQSVSGEGPETRLTHVYGVANLTYEWLNGTRADVSGTSIVNRDARLWSEIDLGGSYSWNFRLTLYTEASANTSVAKFGDSYALKGTAGIRLVF
jgi:fibronectin-binding autotransporter adhesin